jgi:hypothetical protein
MDAFEVRIERIHRHRSCGHEQPTPIIDPVRLAQRCYAGRGSTR